MRRRHRPLSAAILLLFSGCGEGTSSSTTRAPASKEPAAPAVDRSSPEVVLVAAHRALAAGDLDALRHHLTDAGHRRLSGDLIAWRVTVTESKPGGRPGPRVPLPADPLRREAALQALAADDPGPLLRTYIEIEPRPPLPPPPAVVRDPAVDRAELTLPARDGESRLVRFVRGPDGWRIDRLQL